MRSIGADSYATVLAAHHDVVRRALAAHDGREEGTNGDSFFATFTSPSACVAAALSIQRTLGEYRGPGGETLRVRVGIHTGEIATDATGLVGYELHRAARIAAVAHGGQVLLSSTTAALVANSLPAGVTLRDLGPHRLQDLASPDVIFQLVGAGLETDFAPLRSVESLEYTHHLPASTTRFVGRTRDVEELLALIDESRLVTLTGAGGAGKTRLAVETLAAVRRRDGVWFVELASLSDPALVVPTVMTILRLRREEQGAELDSLVNGLRGQSALLALDNCEHLIDTVADVALAIGRHCPGVSIVATSREPLGVDGERVYRVRSLSLAPEVVDGVADVATSDAVELFVTRARAHDASFVLDDSTARAVATICRRLDGIPLALELAASRLATMSLDDLEDRLDQRFRILTGGSRGALPRQQTLGATVAWSYDLLDEPERALLRALSVFAGSFDLRAAEAVGASDIDATGDVVDRLGSLVNKSLVVAERVSTTLRYRLLETIRQYAADQLIQLDGEILASGARRRHAEHYLELCETASPELVRSEQVAWLARLDLEWDNVRSAFTFFASDDAYVEQVVRLAVAGSPFFSTRQHQGPLSHLRRALGSGLALPTTLRAHAQYALAVMTEIAQLDDQANVVANDLLLSAVELSRQLADPSLEAAALVYAAGTSSHISTRADVAAGQAERALDVARRTGDARLIGQALMVVGMTHPPANTAREYYLEAVAKLREAGDVNWVCSALVHLSDCLAADGDSLRESQSLAREGMGIAEELGSTFHYMMHATNYTVWCCLLGEFDAAEREGERVLRTVRRHGVRRDFLVWNVFVAACTAVHAGDFVRGARLTGAHDAIERTLAGSTIRTPLHRELTLREENRARLINALGLEQYERESEVGAIFTLDQVLVLALESRPLAPANVRGPA